MNNIPFLFYLILRFINPVPVESTEPTEPVELLIPMMETTETTESTIEFPAYIHMETGEIIYLEEGMDGTDVDMADLYESIDGTDVPMSDLSTATADVNS